MNELYFVVAIAAIVVMLATVVIVRTIMFTAKAQESKKIDDVYVNNEKAVSDLAEMIKCKTISHSDKNLDDENEFLKFKQTLPKIFPNIYEKCEFTEVGDRALLYRYRGIDSDSPTVLMSHFDVVSVEESEWEKAPFGGVFENGVLWGRGTLDTKATLNGAMQALEALIAEGFVPKNDIYLAFGGDEEVNGGGAAMIVDLFEKQGIKPSIVLDEGGAVVENIFPGVKEPCALIGIAEKGMLNVEFSYSGNGGHASSPKPHSPIVKLSKACLKIENNPFKFRLCHATNAMFDTLARRSNFAYRMIFANLWLFSPVLDMICKKKGGELNALLRTTCVFTQAQGSKGINVIPAKAKMRANLRILPGETMDSVYKYLRDIVDDSEIEIKIIDGNDPSVTSEVNTEGWNRLEEAIHGTWNNAIVSPYLMFACSDSQNWGRISDRVYRFSAMSLTKEERASIHGNNEKITADSVKKTVEFYIRLIKNS